MDFSIAATYVILSGIIVYLLVLLLKRRSDVCVEVRDTTLAAEELQKHAMEIARNHPVGKSSKSHHWLVRRLNENYGVITRVYKAMNSDIKESFPTAPAAEWLLDNFYVIAEQVRFIGRNLSRGRYSRLPSLKKGYLKGYPRVYAIALEIVAHSNGNIDEKTITSFIQAYQSQALLSMGELWAIPLMLRIALIESIRYVCDKINLSRLEWHKAEELAARISSPDIDDAQIEITLKKYLDGMKSISPSFAEHLIRRLRKQGAGVSVVTALINKRLSNESLTVAELTAMEHQVQAEMQLEIGNYITGLKLISDLDWSDIFEILSKVEQILRKDPTGVYGMMDFESRDLYRHEVEKLARAFGVPEIHVACKAVECAENGMGDPPRDHVGYYLVGKGRKNLLGILGKSAGKQWGSFFTSAGKPKILYAGMLIFIIAFTASYLTYYAATQDGRADFLLPAITALLVLIPCSEFAIKITNSIFSHIYRPTMLPKLDLREGIPEEFAAMVIIPTLLTSPESASRLIHQLEVYYLANRDRNLFFALVGDFKDAPAKNQPSDDAVVDTAMKGIAELNRKYSGNGPSVFYYFHRERSYNTSQDRWMGWERKRGAIVELNRLLRGEKDTGYKIVSGDISGLPRIKYVITLDADTNLPMGVAKKLIGTIAHPLNRAVIDEKTGLVKEGYGILQPRISISILSANRSFFTRVFAGQGGIDPYTTAVSDIYQDIFGEGIFSGKGIYEVDIFREVLENRIPDNSVLSHDLLEGCHLRAGLVSDIELVDGYPAGYNSYAARQHRWVRGDWQLLPWLAGKTRNREGIKIKNQLSFLSKWKIFDNIRRSLLYPSLLVLIFAGIVLLPGNSLVWIGFAVLVTVSPVTTGIMNALLSGNMGCRKSKTSSTVITGTKAAVYQSVMLFMLMPHQAYLMADAIIRTVYRVFFTHKNMLEWVTAADVESSARNDMGTYLRKMWFSIAAAVAILISLQWGDRGSIIPSAASALIWIIAPAAAFRASKSTPRKRHRLSSEDYSFLRLVSRKTWSFFEDFAGESDNYLPPDNYQEDPPKGVAHRTSPTNIGLMLISVISACDMGYISWTGMLEKLDKVINTIEKLEKWKGHLYNWYDTISLEMLRPLYVSTVDSGNLVGYMMALREGMKEYQGIQAPRPSMALGLIDTLELAYGRKGTEACLGIRRQLEELGESAGMDLLKWASVLGDIRLLVESSNPADGGDEKESWMKKLVGMAEQYSDELHSFYPFLRNVDLLNILKELDSGLHESMLKPGPPEELLSRYRAAASLLDGGIPTEADAGYEKVKELSRMLNLAAAYIEENIRRNNDIIERITKLIDETEFSPLFNPKRMLFSIGYNAEDGRLSKSYYDLFASEARQASYIAIARGEVDRRHWTRMGRKMTLADGGRALVSWTGTMFEYLMPLLIMRNYESTIFDETYFFVVRAQKKYGKQRRIPWGISESGYSSLDFNLNYQYKAFGIPGLGLKRGLANDMVTAPYASMLALCVDPEAAVDNLRELADLGMDGKWGYYEAIDFTPSRLDKGRRYHIVKSFMAHHQGMSLAALNNFFNDGILQKRFHSNPVIQSAELLLQEKIPEKAVYAREFKDGRAAVVKRQEQVDGAAIRVYGLPESLPPKAHILSNGTYSVMVTDGGSGYSMNGHMAVTRWKDDYFAKNGFYIFIQNINSNTAWSATYDPYIKEPEKYRVVFSPNKAEYVRKDGNIESHLEIAVSPEDNAEIRRIYVTNHSEHTRVIELTSYLEVVLMPRREDAAHPAFSKLFIKTEFVKEKKCLLAVRRQRARGHKQQWLMHTLTIEGDVVGDLHYETDRMKFIGRNRDISNPQALDPDQPLSNSAGSVLDPVLCLRRRIRIGPGQTVKAVFAVAAAHNRKHALELADKFADLKQSERVFELSWTRSQVENRYLGLSAGEVEFYLELVPFILYHNPLRREFAGYIAENTGTQEDLWSFGISGDIPVILVEINDDEDLELVYWALKGHEYWRLKGLHTDLVLLVNRIEGYSKPLNDMIRNAITASHARELVNQPGGVFVGNISEMDKKHVLLLYAVAKLVVRDSINVLKNSIKQIGKMYSDASLRQARDDAPERRPCIISPNPSHERKLLFYNGIGGFSEDGREYVINLGNDRRTPAPWSNVITGRNFGFIVTESGGGYTWAVNSREFKLTPWANDPVTDRQGEIFYIIDEEERNYWSPTPMPAGGDGPYTVRHGFGYSIFEHCSSGLEQALAMYAAPGEPVKVCLMTFRNITGKRRNLTIMYYARPVLGVDESVTAPYIVTWIENGILYAENKYSRDFAGRVAFMCTSAGTGSATGDRVSFFGLDGDPVKPFSVLGAQLSGTTGAGLDPCMAVAGKVLLEPGEETKVVFLLGSAENPRKAAEYAKRLVNPDTAEKELEYVKSYWRKNLEGIQVHTPDDSFDIMMNGWLLYQAIACRIRARSGYYQAGGAYGFRDQLQDSMAVLNTLPELTRYQILLHASRQFKEGDVQHWWHAERGNGIRTRYSDDLLWLPYVTAEYLEKTGDMAILAEQVPFLESSVLDENEDEKYEEPVKSEITASLYEHCVLAIDRSLATGPHGLPLMGCGDWNDGMNGIGNKGRGESVWLGWFLISILRKFIPVCQYMNDLKRVEKYRGAAELLQENIEKEAWDGSWYRRAYFDDGTPLGSAENSECMIDSVSQSWSVISESAKPQRMREAMAAVQKYLIVEGEGLIKLLTPPFDDGELYPGYIKGYVPGVRENGGHYSHAAIWVVLAFAKLGMGDKAGELFHMLNPVNHARTDIEYSRYKVEPYVIAADIYADDQHAGRGGWTWYTGSAGWLYKVGLENIIGFKKKGDRLYFDPCIPKSWEKFVVEYHTGMSSFHIEVRNPERVNRGVLYVEVDGKRSPEGFVDLTMNGFHRIRVVMGTPYESLQEHESSYAHPTL
ncbi:MAG: GH36-type glycosyl hydrolase domain-containing protein [Bacillota bacterium]